MLTDQLHIYCNHLMPYMIILLAGERPDVCAICQQNRCRHSTQHVREPRQSDQRQPGQPRPLSRSRAAESLSTLQDPPHALSQRWEGHEKESRHRKVSKRLMFCYCIFTVQFVIKFLYYFVFCLQQINVLFVPYILPMLIFLALGILHSSNTRYMLITLCY